MGSALNVAQTNRAGICTELIKLHSNAVDNKGFGVTITDPNVKQAWVEVQQVAYTRFTNQFFGKQYSSIEDARWSVIQDYCSGNWSPGMGMA